MSDINTSTMLQVGTVLHGTYRIESYLSSGGFGNTYIAKNIEFGETYAVKEFFVKGVCQRDSDSTTISVSNSENTDSFAQQKEKFKKEARRLRSLNNPHIVKVYDLFEENGTAYYVMDYVDGESLSTRLNRTHSPLSESVVRNYLSQILDGLNAIHAAGIWHLDIKPANIMVDRHDVVKLIDFGASKQQSAAGGATASTGISYTNGYAPSEQMAQSFDKFGPWTDFYALGATLYKLLTNQNPPSVTDLSEDESEDKHIALPMPNVSTEMKKLVVWMMQVNRLKRPKNVREIRKSDEHSVSDSVSDEETVCAAKNNEKKLINGHEAVDLGLSVYWASIDIGANGIGRPGDCFLWGDPDGSKTHKVQSSILARWFMNGPSPSDICENPKYDTAVNLWGEAWHMPRKKEVDELISECTWEQVDENYVKVIGPNGNSIYLDCRWHWTGNSNYNGMILYAWDKRSDGVFAFTHSSGFLKEDYVDCFFPIRPVANK